MEKRYRLANPRRLSRIRDAQVGHDDGGPMGGEDQRGRCADTVVGAGDQGHVTLEPEIELLTVLMPALGGLPSTHFSVNQRPNDCVQAVLDSPRCPRTS